jgi:uncharacterized protein (DUF983 family)
MSITSDLIFCMKPRCPVCRGSRLFKPWSLTVVDKCAACGAPLGAHDIGDGGAVFMIFILCFSIIPLAWGFEVLFAPPLWVHVVLWGVVSLGLIGIMLPAVKAYIVMLEFRHRK